MQLGKLSRRNRRALVWLGGGVLSYVTIFHFFLPFLDWQRVLDDEIQFRQQQVQRYLKALQDKSEYLNHLEGVKSAVSAYEAHFLEASDVNTATLQIEEIVRLLAGQNQIRVTRSNPLPDKRIGEVYARIGVQLNLEGDYDSLINFVHAVSSYEKFLLVEEFQLTSFRVRQETRLQPRLKISGFIRLS